MRRLRMPVCPYCGRRLNYFQSWALKRHGEYICQKCGGLSNVKLDPLVHGVGFLAVVIGLTFFTVGFAFGLDAAVPALTGIAGTGLVFLLLAPFFVRLRKPSSPKRPESDQRQRPVSEEEATDFFPPNVKNSVMR